MLISGFKMETGIWGLSWCEWVRVGGGLVVGEVIVRGWCSGLGFKARLD